MTKNDIQLNPKIQGYCKKHQNNECLAIVIVYHVSNRFSKKKNKNLPLKFGYFHISVSFSTFWTGSWLLIFVSAETSRTIISTDRSEPRLEIHTGVK